MACTNLLVCKYGQVAGVFQRNVTYRLHFGLVKDPGVKLT